MMSRSIRERTNYTIYLTKTTKITNRVGGRVNNSAKFDELEFLDEDNDDGCGRGDHVLPFHWPKGCMQPFRPIQHLQSGILM